MMQQDDSNERVLGGKMRKEEEEGGNTKTMDTDQYQHFIPRFILRKFAQPGLRRVTVWDWWNGRIHVREIKNTFGMFNQYDSAGDENTNKKYVEKRFADLECDMGAILKKIEDSLASDSDDNKTQAGLQLLESEVHTVYKFIGLAGIRNGPFGLSLDPRDNFPTESSPGGYKDHWVKTLEFLLKTPHKDLVEMDEELQVEAYRPILVRYKQLAMMKLFFWTTPVGEEFLLNNFLTVLEGYQYPEENMSSPKNGAPAHVFLPMSTKALLVLCSDSLCKKSMLHAAPHGVTTSYNRPAKGKLGKTEGPKKYQPMVLNWKTIYPIMPISDNDLDTINGLILGLGNVVVYKSKSTLEKVIDNIVSFQQRHLAWRAATKYSNVKVEDENEAIAEMRGCLSEIFRMTGRLLDKSCKEEVKEEALHHHEILGKLICYAVDMDKHPYLFPLLCRSSAYFMGTRKPTLENDLKQRIYADMC